MELTPNDVRNHEFPAKVRGYDKESVDNFREQVANRLETLTHENLKLSMEIESLRTQLTGLKQFEDAIKNAAIDARQNADRTMADAKHQAEELLARARVEADQSFVERTQQKAELELAIAKLELTKKSYLTKLQNLINSHLEWVMDITRTEVPAEQITTGANLIVDEPARVTRKQVHKVEDRLDVTESTEMTSQKRETFATEPTKEKPQKTEEANAASRIVTVDQISSDGDKKDSPIDPELAAALNNYQKVAESIGHKLEGSVDSGATDKVQLPKGFVAKNGKVVVEATTETNVEYSAVNVDEPVDTKAADAPESLAAVLDNVVHKFEEEMDKAARS